MILTSVHPWDHLKIQMTGMSTLEMEEIESVGIEVMSVSGFQEI